MRGFAVRGFAVAIGGGGGRIGRTVFLSNYVDDSDSAHDANATGSARFAGGARSFSGGGSAGSAGCAGEGGASAGSVARGDAGVDREHAGAAPWVERDGPADSGAVFSIQSEREIESDIFAEDALGAEEGGGLVYRGVVSGAETGIMAGGLIRGLERIK